MHEWQSESEGGTALLVFFTAVRHVARQIATDARNATF